MMDRLHLSGKGAGIFADGMKRAVDSGLGNVRYLNWLGRGDWQSKLNVDKMIAVPV